MIKTRPAGRRVQGWAAAWVLGLGLLGPACAMDITLKMPTLPDGRHLFYYALLTRALEQAGHKLTIIPMDNLPQTRMLLYLDSGALDLDWLVQSKERDKRFVPVDFGVTHGLIGQRVLLIPKGTEADYAGVRTLQDFTALHKTAGLGKGWFDTRIWQENGLQFSEQEGDWRLLYAKLASRARGIDYFPRGAQEVTSEATSHPELAIEPRLLLVYQRDIHFYLSRARADLKPVLEAALHKAEKSGLQQQLLNEFFGPALANLNLSKRVQINLKLPAE